MPDDHWQPTWRDLIRTFWAIFVCVILWQVGSSVFNHFFPKPLNEPLTLPHCQSSRCLRYDPYDGLFIDKPKVLKGSLGRMLGGLEDTAILLEHTNFNDTMRWLDGIVKSRIADSDLWVYIYFGPSVTEDAVRQLRIECRMRQWIKGVHVSRVTDSTLAEEVLKIPQKQYIISVRDTDYMGADFADFYFYGKRVIQLKDRTNCVCGGDSYKGNHTDVFFKPTRGDLMWLTDNNKCTKGLMAPREYFTNDKYQLHLCLRPEVWRVSDSAQHVTTKAWKLPQLDPRDFTVRQFFRRREHDYKYATSKHAVEWDTLKSADDDEVYVFPYENVDDLKFYLDDEQFEVVLNTKFLDGAFMFHYEGHQIYIIPASKIK